MNNDQIDLGSLYGLGSSQNVNMPYKKYIDVSPMQQMLSDTTNPETINTDNGTSDNFIRDIIQKLDLNSNNIQNNMMQNENGQNSISKSRIQTRSEISNGALSGMSNLNNTVSNNLEFHNNFLRSQLGRLVEISCMANNEPMKITGYLLGVGTDYIMLNEYETSNIVTLMCKDAKLIRIFY